jgi:hypothetical protein
MWLRMSQGESKPKTKTKMPFKEKLAWTWLGSILVFCLGAAGWMFVSWVGENLRFFLICVGAVMFLGTTGWAIGVVNRAEEDDAKKN